MCLALTTARWRLKLKDKAPYLPEACNDEALFRWEGGAGEAAGEPAPDPLERPDILPEEEEPEDGFLPLPFDPFGGAYAPCPCCGADIPDPPSPGLSARCATGKSTMTFGMTLSSRATKITVSAWTRPG